MSGVRKLLQGKPVAYYPALARALGGIAPALFFQQVAHWQGEHDERWVFRTQEELEEELAMSAKVQATCRRHLLDGGFIEEERRAKNRLHYRPIWENVEAALQTLPSGNSRPTQAASLDQPNRRNSLNENKEENKETTPPVSPPRGKSFKAEDSVDYAVKFEQFVEDDELGPLLARLVKLAGAENKSRRMRYSRAWNEFVLGLQMLREEGFTDQALRFALSEAIKRQAPNMNYVKKTAKSYVPDQPEQGAIDMRAGSSMARRKQGYEWLFDDEAEPKRDLDAELKAMRESA